MASDTSNTGWPTGRAAGLVFLLLIVAGLALRAYRQDDDGPGKAGPDETVQLLGELGVWYEKSAKGSKAWRQISRLPVYGRNFTSPGEPPTFKEGKEYLFQAKEDLVPGDLAFVIEHAPPGLTAVTLAGASKLGDDSLSPLTGREGLRHLYLTGTSATEEGVAELRQKLPDCTVYFESNKPAPEPETSSGNLLRDLLRGFRGGTR